jgi:hypothetical protein
MNTETLTALGIGLTATAVICLVIRAYRYLRPVEDDIDWERGQ